jgi:hypothetical protein
MLRFVRKYAVAPGMVVVVNRVNHPGTVAA